MRVLNRVDFLKMPEGTIYAKGVPWAFCSLSVKGKTVGNDWIYLDPAWVSARDSGHATNRLGEMLSNGASYPAEDAWGRDGCFDDAAVFLVFERADLLELRKHIDCAVSLWERGAQNVDDQG